MFINHCLNALFSMSILTSTMLNAYSQELSKDDYKFAEAVKVKKCTSRKYSTFNYPSPQSGGQTLLTGIRGVKGNEEEVYITGFYNSPNGVNVIPFVYKGTLAGEGTWNVLNYPSSTGRTVTETNLYGPNNGSKSNLQVVGNYTTLETGGDLGCLYEGPLDGSGKWTTLIPTSSKPVLNTIAHSTMGGLVVGNYSTQKRVSKAFIYDIKKKEYYKIIKPEAKDITAYGIWHNHGYSYTICGGYSDLNATTGLGSAYLVDWDNKSHTFSNWRSYNYGNDPAEAVVTHFDGITSNDCGGYYLTGDWLKKGDIIEQGFFCEIKRKHAKWTPLSYPGKTITSGNSVYKKIVIGSYASIKDFSVNGYISEPRACPACY